MSRAPSLVWEMTSPASLNGVSTSTSSVGSCSGFTTTPRGGRNGSMKLLLHDASLESEYSWMEPLLSHEPMMLPEGASSAVLIETSKSACSNDKDDSNDNVDDNYDDNDDDNYDE